MMFKGLRLPLFISLLSLNTADLARSISCIWVKEMFVPEITPSFDPVVIPPL